ncbi:OLC1v1026245C1 [Oldenlandia corymbosa var. corymbosa]|uniref:non-specific serine/threonine protein kinase n=1 Tax=Oldenlandia corymbosa var. corymbosa TaxID=529605 RepID=A0AAV1C6P6_OLDCO|nr:OLC1v1026245C1 [Oldenlandia corymbosa var. corymbosa]
MPEREARDFTFLINDYIVEKKADVVRWNGIGIPLYRDFLVIMEGDREGSKSGAGIGAAQKLFKLSITTDHWLFGRGENQSVFSGIKSKQARNLTSMAELKDLQSKGNDSFCLQKPFWVWPLKAHFYLGNKHKVERSPFKELPLYCYETLAGATQNFHPQRKLRYVSFATVYKGILSSGQEIVVKRHSGSQQQENMEFRNEYMVMSQLQHHNLVRALGCCVERKEKMLIYEYLPNGTLDAILFDPGKQSLLDWTRRESIIKGIATSLHYLNRNSRFKVIRGDLTASNILLDRELNPKISIFRVSRFSFLALLLSLDTASDCLTEGLVSEKSDVYSFGVLLLEIIREKRCSTGGIGTDYLGLIGWAWKLWIDNKTVKLVDPAILSPGIELEIVRYIHVARVCTCFDVELPPPKLPVYSAWKSVHGNEICAQHGDSVRDSTTWKEDSSLPCCCSECTIIIFWLSHFSGQFSLYLCRSPGENDTPGIPAQKKNKQNQIHLSSACTSGCFMSPLRNTRVWSFFFLFLSFNEGINWVTSCGFPSRLEQSSKSTEILLWLILAIICLGINTESKEESLQQESKGTHKLFHFRPDKQEYMFSIISPVLIWVLFPCILLPIFVNCDVALNSGCDHLTLTALDGREWVGESVSSYYLSGKSRSSTAGDQTSSFPGFDPVPYKTSRISATEFHYNFYLEPGQKFIRLHFFPASYRGFERSIDYFNVKAGPFTLLKDYSASFIAETLGVKYIVKEFCLNIEESKHLKISFIPSQNSSLNRNVHAFVNGIEIISMPTGLYYTLEGEVGPPIVGLTNRFYIIDNSTALEVVQRFNVGGTSIPPVEDVGLFRRWNQDTDYFLDSAVIQVNHQELKIKYITIPTFIAPLKIFQTSWKIGRSPGANQMYKLRWKVPVDLGFGYLVRLHFCHLDSIADLEQREFSVLINNQIAEAKANVIKWSGGAGIPVYRDYVIILKGEFEGSKSSLLIGLESSHGSVLKLLNGLEIFKLSDLRNNLAAPKPVFPERIITSKDNVSLIFSKINVFGTGMTILIILLSLLTYEVRFFWEANLHDGKHPESATVEECSYLFSLADIKKATENFSEELVIGRGGFGSVYKGSIPGVAKTAAIKRLNPSSRQGAREFWTEIETLSKLRHYHLVSLIGYCNEHQEMILVYEYMPCGTLADNLYKFPRNEKEFTPLTWEQRLRICIGAARGLEYLHTGSQYGVIHRDVKDTNILLDENFVAKISDFGLSKLERTSHSKSYVSTNVKGTVGYLDPDYFRTHRLTRKSDVYSFGIVMLVILSGKPAVNSRRPRSMLTCFQDCIADGDFGKILDLSLQGKISSDGLGEFVNIVGNCLQEMPKRRPTMSQVVADLEQVLKKHGGENGFASVDIVDQPCDQSNIHSFHFQLKAESIISAPSEGITSTTSRKMLDTQNSLTRGAHLQLRGQDSAPGRKALWVWPWRAVWNRGNRRNAQELVPHTSGNKLQAVESFPADVLLYDYQTLADATRNFHPENLIRSGVSGNVYKGTLRNGEEVVVRTLLNASNQGDVEFRGEVVSMRKLEHHNIVRLIGCCAERSQRMLVNEYMPSLDAYLFDSAKADLLDWNRRKVIIEGIACGLLYLHRDSNVKTVHGDLNPSNILLDKELKPKIYCPDFGRILKKLRDPTSTLVSRAQYYMAPEYFILGIFSEKSDVYSYGRLILEIITGKMVFFWDNGSVPQFERWAWKFWEENEMIEVDPAILCPDTETEISRYVHIGGFPIEFRQPDDLQLTLPSTVAPMGSQLRVMVVNGSENRPPISSLVNPGQKILRLHFCSASYTGFDKSFPQFSVKAGPFTLLKDYNPAVTVNSLGTKHIVKEFFLNVEPNEQLAITFSPSLIGESKSKVYAFVNGIEIISMPMGLYYTPEHELGARLIGSNRYFIVENSTALEVIQRLNIGGSSIPPAEDVSLFRQWNEDIKYLVEPKARRVDHLALKIKLSNVPALIAPPKIYQTCWKTDTSMVKKMYHFKWKVPIDLGFAYLVRLHFCELNYGMAERESREFSILVNNQIAEAKADVLTWSGDIGIPVYRDYVVIMEGNKEGRNSDLLIEMQSRDALAFGLLNGLEIFKLSNLNNELAAAAPKLEFPKRMYLAFGLTNRTGTSLRLSSMILFLAVVLIYYILVKLGKKKSQVKKCAQSVSVKPSCLRFSLAKIKKATQNFSEASVIGRGGFAVVYKGCIQGIAGSVAIKRLKSNSTQGAQEFWAEIKTLSELRHKHLVSLIGYCNESGEMILIYEYISGKPAVDKTKPGEPLSLILRFRQCMADGDIKSMVDPDIKGEIPSKVLAKFVKDIESCLLPLPKKRPTMTQLVVSLEQALEHHLDRVKSPPPMEKIRAKSTQGTSSSFGRKEVQVTGRGSKPVRKPFWNSLVKDLWNTDDELVIDWPFNGMKMKIDRFLGRSVEIPTRRSYLGQ